MNFTATVKRNAKSNVYTVSHNGEVIATRTSKGRAYSHVVLRLDNNEVLLADARAYSRGAQERKNFEFLKTTNSPYAQRLPEGTTYEQYVATQDEASERAYGGEAAWGAVGYCSRLDLAQKLASSERAKRWVAYAVVVAISEV